MADSAPAPRLPPDQEKRLRQQHKKRVAELGRAQEAGGNKEAELLSTLQAQAQRSDKAQREAANAETVAAAGLAAAEAELGGARKKSGVLAALATDLQTRQSALLQKKHAMLAREDEQREQLSAAFKDKLGTVRAKLEQLAEQRTVQIDESGRLRAELEAFTEGHAASERQHATALLALDAAHQALELELHGSAEQLAAARRREEELGAARQQAESAVLLVQQPTAPGLLGRTLQAPGCAAHSCRSAAQGPAPSGEDVVRP